MAHNLEKLTSIRLAQGIRRSTKKQTFQDDSVLFEGFVFVQGNNHLYRVVKTHWQIPRLHSIEERTSFDIYVVDELRLYRVKGCENLTCYRTTLNRLWQIDKLPVEEILEEDGFAKA